ncbi:MAG: leucine-rich repeat domain-containing protein [Clostridia bacterium]|nr:leucine-rich repeat domain-containing protein [Clostridia bacterium]
MDNEKMSPQGDMGAAAVKGTKKANVISLVTRFFIALLAVSLIMLGFTYVKNNFLDSDITWSLSEKGELTIKGEGAIEALDPLSPSEWLDLESGKKVKSVVISKGITSIGDYAFYKCQYIESVIIADTVTEIGDFAFQGCTKLKKVVVPEKVTAIGEGAFYGCAELGAITLPKGLCRIGYDAFYGTACYKSDSVWSGGAMYIDGHLVCADKEFEGVLDIKEGTLSVADCAFSGCGAVSEVNMPDSVKSVGAYAFQNCDGLESVRLSDSLSLLPEGLFHGCKRLTTVSYGGSGKADAGFRKGGSDFSVVGKDGKVREGF